MNTPWETLKLLSDPTRLRLLCLLAQEELSVAELQEILDMGQSRISTHLGLLRGADIVLDRKQGKNSFYQVNPNPDQAAQALLQAAQLAVRDDPQIRADTSNLSRILERRRRAAEQYFNQVAGRLGKNYCPGRSWEAIAHFLLHLTPAITIADLGAGESVLSQLLARRAKHVYCVDSSPRMVEFGTELARKHGIENLSYSLGDIEEVPLADASVDLALLSQALHHARKPRRAVEEAYRILRPGGRLIILDLKEHTFEQARDLYADLWLGFSENQLYRWLRETGFTHAEISVVAREDQEPGFQTLLASASKE